MDSSYLFRATLLDQLHRGHWQVGERLPPEREWCEQYQISRSTVRKVLAELKAQGLIAQTVGSGTYVTDKAVNTASLGKTPPQAMPDAAWQTSPAELMEARMALEPAIIEMVIGNATSADFEQMASAATVPKPPPALRSLKFGMACSTKSLRVRRTTTLWRDCSS